MYVEFVYGNDLIVIIIGSIVFDVECWVLIWLMNVGKSKMINMGV